jgi:hypothetical protein
MRRRAGATAIGVKMIGAGLSFAQLFLLVAPAII